MKMMKTIVMKMRMTTTTMMIMVVVMMIATHRCSVQSEQVLASEEHYASGVQTKHLNLVPLPTGRVAVHTRFHATGHSFDDVGHDGHGDEESCHVVKDECGGWCLRILESPPHPLSDRSAWVALVGFVWFLRSFWRSISLIIVPCRK